MTEKKYLSDFLNVNDFVNLSTNKHYFIIAGTGAGKSRFVKNDFSKMIVNENKRLLILVNRTMLKMQMQDQLICEDKIEVMNYQALTQLDKAYLDAFDYIICDEVHYFINDSWNGYTQDELEIVKNSKAIKIYMTATYQSVMKIFNSDEIEILYKQDGIEEKLHNKQKNIRKIFKTHNNLRFLTELDKNENKSLIVFSKIADAYNYHNKLGDSIFNCSRSNKEHYKHVNKDQIKFLIEKSYFDSKYLCTTTVLESGVNIIDNKLSLIGYHGYFTKDIVEQIAGRKRFEFEDDILDFIVYEPSNYTIANNIKLLEDNIRKLEIAQREGITAVLKERRSKFEQPQWLRIENDGSLTIDYTKVEKIKSELDWLYKVKEIGISGYLAEIHGINSIIDLDKNDLISYLGSVK